MKTELIFPTPVWKFDNVGIDRESLRDFVYLVKSEDPAGRVHLIMVDGNHMISSIVSWITIH